jgi:two-component system sensor histidine kinase/response regulator
MALDTIDLLNARIAHLEDNRRYIQNALEMVLSLEDFYTEIGGDRYCLETLLPEAKRRIDSIFPFEVLAFYMVDESDLSFQPAFLYPEHLSDAIEREVEIMIDEGYFAWALRERRGVVISSADHSRQYLLHVIANHNQVKGMFGGLLPADHASLPDTAMTLLSIILLHVANAAESMAYTSLLKNQSQLLEQQVAERTKALTLSQQELELAMNRANALAEDAQAASRAKGDFLAKMSHELRTPLNGIIGMTEAALSTPLDDNQRRIIEIIGRESFSLLRQINDVLDFSKIESGKLELERIDFDLRTQMEEIGESFVFQTSEKGVELNVFLDPAVPAALVGDPVRLRQILMNLVGNAVKFTQKGEIFIDAVLDEMVDDHARIRFCITDTGIGIETQNLDRIFSSFSQADDSTTRRYGGTGLGTTISKQLVELMGGQIGVDSLPGQGSTFWFTAEFDIQGVHQPPADEQITDGEMTVMVVDGNTTTCRILSSYLDHLGVSAVTATDGMAALALLEDRAAEAPSIDVIIVDARIFNDNAISLKDRIRRMTQYTDTPIVVTTSLKAVVTGGEDLSVEYSAALCKPIKIDDLKRVLCQVSGCAGAETISDQENESPAGATHCESHPNAEHTGHILVADDYLINQKVAYMHLTAAGFTVDLVENGQQVVDAFERTSYDMIFMDIQMPIVNGLDAATSIRQIEATGGCGRRIPIIALTANALKEHEQKCLDAGMDGYLVKPVHRHQLIETARQWIGQQDNPARCSGSPGEAVSPATPADTDSDIFDAATAVDEFGDADTVKIVAHQLIDNVTNQLTTIRSAIDDGDRECIRKEAHAIKGGAATMEAVALSAAAAHLEKICPNGNPGALETGYGELQSQFNRFREIISQWGEQK